MFEKLKLYRKRIYIYFLASFMIPPMSWFLVNWYTGAFTTDIVITILLFPALHLYILFYVSFSFYFFRRKLNHLFDYVLEPDLVIVEDAQKKIRHVQNFFFLTLLGYVIFGPLVVQEALRDEMTDVAYISGWLSGLPLIFIYSGPFVILFIKNFGQSMSSLPFIDKYRSMSFIEKSTIIIGANALGTVIVLSVYSYQIAYLFHTQENFLSFLFEKLIVLSVTSLLIVSLNLYLFFRSFARPITKLRNNLHNLAEGDADLTSQLDVTTRDEFGEMAFTFNTFVGRIREIVTDTNNVAGGLRSSGKEMVDITKEFEMSSKLQMSSIEEITTAVDQMAAQIDGISGHAKIQLDDVLSLSDTLKHWNSITKKMEVSLDDILKNLDRSSKLATEGDRELQQTENSIITIAESAERITQIVAIIEDIADKIELLALNAAIEAARAGESGRGFAVVSSEISKLAEMTSGSIQEISKLVQQNNSQVESGVNSVKTTVSTIEQILQGTKQIADRMSILDELMKEQIYINGLVQHDSNDVRMQAQGISDASAEQKKGIQSIMKSVEMIRHVSEKTASGAQNINKHAIQNEGISKKLNDKVSQFSV